MYTFFVINDLLFPSPECTVYEYVQADDDVYVDVDEDDEVDENEFREWLSDRYVVSQRLDEKISTGGESGRGRPARVGGAGAPPPPRQKNFEK